MDTVDASIPLAVKPPTFDPLAAISEGLQLRQQFQQFKQANALKAIAGQPDAIDPKTGAWTPNALKQITRLDPNLGMKAATEASEVTERAAQTEHARSETQVADLARHADELSSHLATYDAEVASGNVDPSIAEKDLKSSVKGYIDSQPWDTERKASVWGPLSTMEPAKLRQVATNLSMTAAERKQASKDASEGEFGQMTLPDGTTKTVWQTKDGQVLDPNTRKPIKIEGLVEHEATPLDPTRAKFMEEGVDLRAQALKDAEEGRKPFTMNGKTVFIDKHGNAFDQNNQPTEITGPLTTVGSGSARSGTALAMQAFMKANPDATPEEIAHFSAGYTAAIRQAGAIGTRRGQVEFSEAELENAAKLSHEAYIKLPRGQFLPFNELTKKLETATSSPEQAAAYAADNTVVNTYARMVSPTGVGTDSDKQHAREMLNTAQSQEAHQAVIDQLMKEGQASREGAQTALEESAKEPVVSSTTPGGKKSADQSGGNSQSYKTATDVVGAYHAGKLTKAQAAKILRDEGWAQ